MISPLILQAQITPPLGGGSFGLADTTRLENPFQTPMWIDEIRFRLADSAVLGGPSWSRLKVELKLGNITLTNGFVPIGLLGKVLNDSFGETRAPICFTWRLPKPLFIPARELLRPTLYLEPFTANDLKTVTIIYCCRPLPVGTPTPTTLQIPWVTYFKPPNLVMTGAVDTTNQSTPSDLFNPWDEELRVQRFTGRLMGSYTGAGIEDSDYMSLASAQVNLATGKPTYGTFVSAQDSFNNILIRDATPFAHVFDFIDRAWTVNCVLPPKGFYLFTVDRYWSGYTPTLGTTTATVGIGMVGWREVTAKNQIDRRNLVPLPIQRPR